MHLQGVPFYFVFQLRQLSKERLMGHPLKDLNKLFVEIFLKGQADVKLFFGG